MTTRQEVLDYGMTLSGAYVDAPFHDENWILLRYRKNKKAFAWTYEKDGHMWVNVKVDPEWRDLWRNTYEAVIPGYHQNKEHWNSVSIYPYHQLALLGFGALLYEQLPHVLDIYTLHPLLCS